MTWFYLNTLVQLPLIWLLIKQFTIVCTTSCSLGISNKGCCFSIYMFSQIKITLIMAHSYLVSLCTHCSASVNFLSQTNTYRNSLILFCSSADIDMRCMDAAFSNASDEAFYCMVSDAAIKQLNPICYSCISCIMMVRRLLIWFICD